MRDAFLRGYLGEPQAGVAAYLPTAAENVHALIALFELEKAYYELAYEINNRPDWVSIPLEGIRRITALG
jgi:maltokinase